MGSLQSKVVALQYAAPYSTPPLRSSSRSRQSCAWRLWIDRSAERRRIPRAILQDLIVAIIKDSEKKARDAETAARRQELAVRRERERKQREQKRIDKRAEYKRKEKEKAFESLISLPREQQETRLGELAKRLDEDVAIIRDDFTAFVGMQSWAASTDSWNVELWPDPVERP